MSHWFKRKKYGYGWNPSSLKGWLVLALYSTIQIFAAIILLSDKPTSFYEVSVIIYAGFFLVTTLVLLATIRRKGPRAIWQWGESKIKKPKDGSV